MANYASIKAEIVDQIYANNAAEITGPVLQQVLLDLVANLTVGYQYAGVAAPATDPGTVDQKVFYLAPAGSYIHFGASEGAPYVVPDGCFGIFRFDTAWRREYIRITPPAPVTFATCDTAGATAAKVVAADNFQLAVGAQIRITMEHANAAEAPTLNVNGTGAKALYYDGEAAGAANTWEDGETILAYYDGTRWQSSNAQGGGGKFLTGEKVKQTAITDEVDGGSDALVKSSAVAEAIKDFAEVDIKSTPFLANSALQEYIRQNTGIDGTNGRIVPNNNQFDSIFIPVQAGTKYVIRGEKMPSRNTADVNNLWFYSSVNGNGTVVGGKLVEYPNDHVVFTVPEGASYVGIVIAARGYVPQQGGNWDFDSAETIALDLLDRINLSQGGTPLLNVSNIAHLNPRGTTLVSNAEMQQYIIENKIFNGGRADAPIVSSNLYSMLMMPVKPGQIVTLTGLQNTGVPSTDIQNVVFYSEYMAGYVSGFLFPFDGVVSELKATVPDGAAYIAICVRDNDAGYNFNSASTIAASVYEMANFVDNDGNPITEPVLRRSLTTYEMRNAEMQPYILTDTVINGANGQIVYNQNQYDTLLMPAVAGSKITFNGLKWYSSVPTDVAEIWFYKKNGTSFTVVSSVRATRIPDYPAVVTIPAGADYVGLVLSNRDFNTGSEILNFDGTATVTAFVENGAVKYTIWGTPTGDEIEKRIANLGGGGGGAQAIDMGLPRDLPKVYIESELLTVVKDGQGNPTNQILPLTTSKNEVGDLDAGDVTIRVESDSVNFTDAIVIAYQGQSSLTAAKKNFSIDCKHKHRFGKWLPMDGFHLKGYNSDWLHIRDIMANRIYEQMLQSRAPEIRRPFCAANDFSAHDVALLAESAVLCHVDGWPCELYINGDYWGIYSLNLKKHRSNYHLGKSDVQNIQIDPNWQTMTPAGWNWRLAEVRNPKSDSGNTEFVEGTVPNPGEVRTWMETVLTRLASITGGTSLDSLRTWMNVDNWVDVILFEQFIGGWDVFNRNNLYTTWDGNLLSILPYDHDGSFGIGLSSSVGSENHVGGDVVIAPSYDVFTRAYTYCPWLSPLVSALRPLLVARYKELRDQGIFSAENVKSQANAWTMQIGFDAYGKDLDRWVYEGYGASALNPGFYDSTNRIVDWINSRIGYLDGIYG